MDCQCRFLRAGILGAVALASFASVQFAGDQPRPHVTALPLTPVFIPVITPVKPAIPPGFNFASAVNGGQASGGRDAEQLIDGNDSVYTGGTGFAQSLWNATPPQPFVITLKEPAEVQCIRFLLWDRDERYYRYRIETSADDGDKWTLLQDRTGATETCKSWQVIRTKPLLVKKIRLTGTFNSANAGFHVVELQAFAGDPPNMPAPAADALDF